jgi:sugar/nucleoside kinase (ribokinase family)
MRVTLETRIRIAVKGALEKALEKALGELKSKYPDGRELAFLVGNGLTRTAAELEGSPSLSWAGLCRNALTTARVEHSLEYLASLGYDYSEIFEYALRRAEDKDKATVWRDFWKRLSEIPPSFAHRVLVSSACPIVTTNYDDLFEQAAETSVPPVKLARRALEVGDTAEQSAFTRVHSSPGGLPLFKIHGSLPPRKPPEGPKDWLEEKGHKKTVAELKSYQTIALCDDDVFFGDRLFGPVRAALQGKTVLVLGLGLQAEELVLARLLTGVMGYQSAEPTYRSPILLALVVEPDSHPLHHLERWGIMPIRVPIGLVSSATSRLLATLILLKELSLKHNKDQPVALAEFYIEQLRECPKLLSRTGDSPRHAYPRILAVGQAAWSRVLGFEEALAQERAYSPTKAQALPWAPDGSPRPLITEDPGGQALVPVLVWDALRIPSALVSRIYTDEAGGKILAYLGSTNWVDYEWVSLNQRLTRPKALADVPAEVSATEHSTVATWFGLRTILDSPRDIHDTSGDPTKFDSVASGRCFKLGSPVVYATKVDWQAVRDALDIDKVRPLIVYDTGGRGNKDAETWVSEREGIVIASIYSALEWCFSSGIGTWEDENGPCEFERWRRAREPKDDRGRLFQIHELLVRLREVTDGPAFLQPSRLGKLRAYIVTLGELGCIYWVRNGETWQEPGWSYVKRCLDPSREAENDKEARDGLGCGDVARAGFVASALATMDYSDDLSKLTEPAIKWAIGWANWFGYQKLRYFSLRDFLDYVRRHDEHLELRHDVSRQLVGTVTIASPSCCAEEIAFEPFLGSAGHAADGLETWLTTATQLLGENRRPWDDRIQRWQERRGYKLSPLKA